MLRSMRGSRLPMATVKTRRRSAVESRVDGSTKKQQEQAIKTVPPEATQSSAQMHRERPSDVRKTSASSDGQHSVVHRDGVAEEGGEETRTAQGRVGSGQAEPSELVRWSSFPVVGRGLARASPRNANKVLDDPRTHAQCRPYTDPPERRCRSTLSGERLYK